MKRLNLKISGMSCEGCEELIRGILEKQEGVIEARVSHKFDKAVVYFDNSRISERDIKSIIRHEGYKAE